MGTSVGERIIVALDTPDKQQALTIARVIAPVINKVKVGMELFYSQGPSVLEELQQLGVQVFLDLKVHDIPNTAAGAAASLSRHGVWMWNVHAAGGKQMMERAREAADQACTKLGIVRPLLIAVTQLTSTSQQVMEEEIGIREPIADTVVRYARMAQEAGLDGVVASAQEVPYIKQHCGASFLTVTPGIRMPDSQADDQVRVTSPKQALELGTDYMVIGRNITKAADPLEAAKAIIRSTDTL